MKRFGSMWLVFAVMTFGVSGIQMSCSGGCTPQDALKGAWVVTDVSPDADACGADSQKVSVVFVADGKTVDDHEWEVANCIENSRIDQENMEVGSSYPGTFTPSGGAACYVEYELPKVLE
jgi:hypothetical protein